MKIQDILLAAASFPLSFQKALATVLPEECEFEHDGVTIRKERADSHGWTFAGLNQQDDDLRVDENGNVTSSADWIASKYYQNYWLKSSCNRLPNPICILVFCQGVNIGIDTAAKLLQLALNDYGSRLVVDGGIGPATFQATMACPDLNGLSLAFLAKNRTHYRQLHDPNNDLPGWLNRVDDLQSKYCTT
jgi:hypothetical protein